LKHKFHKYLLPPLFLLFVSPIFLTGGIFDKEKEKEEVKISGFEMEKPETVKAIYLTAYSVASAGFPGFIDKLLETGGNAVVMDIEISGGKLAFEPKNEYLKTINPGSNTLHNLKEIVNYLHKRGVYAIARQVVFNDPYTASRKPEWRIKYKYSEGLFDSRWLDPSKPGVHNYNLMIMKEIAQLGFDEVQFDYIRFPAENHSILDYHYDEANFERWEVILDYLKKARRIADEEGVEIAVDVFGAAIWGNVDWKMVGQHIPSIAQYVDVIYPMTYPSHVSPGYYGFNNPYGDPYEFVHGSIEKFVEAAGTNTEIRTWVQGFPLKMYNFGEHTMEDQVRATFDAGGTGFAIWSPGNRYGYSWSSMGLERELEEAGAL